MSSRPSLLKFFAHRRDGTSAAGHRWHHHSLRHLHLIAARGFARQGNPAARRLGHAARYLAVNDAAARLSKYFLSQFLINSAYGLFIALGLWLIGVPSPIVWGILAMLMRFVPYVGSFIRRCPPLLLAAVVEPGWTTFLLTALSTLSPN
jgi:predicted PurR-regulated permease PerM